MVCKKFITKLNLIKSLASIQLLEEVECHSLKTIYLASMKIRNMRLIIIVERLVRPVSLFQDERARIRSEGKTRNYRDAGGSTHSKAYHAIIEQRPLVAALILLSNILLTSANKTVQFDTLSK